MAAPSSTERFPSLKAALLSRKKDTVLFLLRLATLFSSIAYVAPFIGSAWFYRRSLLIYALVSVIRLSQRLPAFEFSRQYFQHLFTEDSFHYFLYSLSFLGSFPFPLVLIPVGVFSLMHTASFLKSIRENLPESIANRSSTLSSAIENSSISLFRAIAFSEIALFPILILARLGGLGSLLTILLHYQFLTLRYTSRRNPYTRVIFYDLRLKFESIRAHPSCPSIVQKAITAAIAFVSRLCPVNTYATPERP